MFCKPNGNFIYTDTHSGISFRSLNLQKDLTTVHRWANMDYSRDFWQLAEGKAELSKLYKLILQDPNLHSFIGLFEGKRICQIDIYRVQNDELGMHIKAQANDCGIHLLMGPPEESIHGLSTKVMRSFLSFYFSFKEAQCLYAEPDIRNYKACRLLERSGFIFQQNVMLSTKAASLYSINKFNFHASH